VPLFASRFNTDHAYIVRYAQAMLKYLAGHVV
jgi:hypothetical protein